MKCNILVGVATCLLIAAARGQDRCVKGDRAPLSPRLPHAPLARTLLLQSETRSV